MFIMLPGDPKLQQNCLSMTWHELQWQQCNSPVWKVFLIFWTMFSVQHFLCFQMMLKCKDKKWYQFWSVTVEEQSSMDTTVTFHWPIWTHRDPHPCVCPFIHPSKPSSLGHLGFSSLAQCWILFLPQSKGWNWGVDRGEGQPQREQINGVLLCFCLLVYLCSTSPPR